jgi:hypothetical protein
VTPADALQTSCAGKGRFPTQQLAAERAKRMRQRKRRERPATVYQCFFLPRLAHRREAPGHGRRQQGVQAAPATGK